MLLADIVSVRWCAQAQYSCRIGASAALTVLQFVSTGSSILDRAWSVSVDGLGDCFFAGRHRPSVDTIDTKHSMAMAHGSGSGTKPLPNPQTSRLL